MGDNPSRSATPTTGTRSQISARGVGHPSSARRPFGSLPAGFWGRGDCFNGYPFCDFTTTYPSNPSNPRAIGITNGLNPPPQPPLGATALVDWAEAAARSRGSFD